MDISWENELLTIWRRVLRALFRLQVGSRHKNRLQSTYTGFHEFVHNIPSSELDAKFSGFPKVVYFEDSIQRIYRTMQSQFRVLAHLSYQQSSFLLGCFA